MSGRGILALDLGNATGVAYGEDFQKPTCFLWVLKRDDEPEESKLGRRMSRLAKQLEDFFEVSRPEMVIYEAPVSRNQTSARGLIYLAGVVEMICDEWDIPCREAHVGEPRKLILGKSAFFARGDDGKVIRNAKGKMISETKPTVMAWAQAQGYEPATHDVADALLLLRYAHTIRRSRTMAGRAA